MIFILTGCVKMCSVTRDDMSPQQVVEAYLEIAFNMEKVDQRRILLDYTTGDLEASISMASLTMIEELYIKPQYKIENLYIAEPQYRTPVECEVSYTLTYKELMDLEGLTDKTVTTTQNIVSLVQLKEKWYIQGVIDKKSSVEFPLLKVRASH